MYLYIKYESPDSMLATGYAVYSDAMALSVNNTIADIGNVWVSCRNVRGWDDVGRILSSTSWSSIVDPNEVARYGTIMQSKAHNIVVIVGDVAGLSMVCEKRGWSMCRLGDSDAYSISMKISLVGIRGL